MKQRIAHGVIIDAATPSEVEEAVTAATTPNPDDRRHEKGVVKLDASGNGSQSVTATRQYDWYLERCTVGGGGAPNALVTVYSNDTTSDTDMLEVIQLGTAGKYSDSFSNNLWIAAGTKIIVRVIGGVPGGDVTFNFQIQQVRVA